MVSVSNSSLSLAAGAMGTVEVSLKGLFTVPGIYNGSISITGPNTNLSVPFWYLESDGTPYNIIPVYDGTFTGTVGDTCWYLAFKVVDQYGIAIPNLPDSLPRRKEVESNPLRLRAPRVCNLVHPPPRTTTGSPGATSIWDPLLGIRVSWLEQAA